MTTNNNTSNIPADLVAKLASLTNEIEAAIRQDERARVREQIVEAWNNHGVPLREGLAKATGNQTGMHGEPLAAEQAKPRVKNLTAGHLRVRDLLAGSRYLAKPTLAGLTDLRRSTVSTYLRDLQAHGYVLEKKRVGGLDGKRGYRIAYRLASTVSRGGNRVAYRLAKAG